MRKASSTRAVSSVGAPVVDGDITEPTAVE